MVRKIQFEIAFSNRILYNSILLGIILLIGIGVYASPMFNHGRPKLVPGVAPNPGHTIDYLAPPAPCADNSFLQFNGTTWVCADVNDWTNSGGMCPSGYALVKKGDQLYCAKTGWEIDCTCWKTGGEGGWVGAGVTCHAKRESNGKLYTRTEGKSDRDWTVTCDSGWVNSALSRCSSDFGTHRCIVQASADEGVMNLTGTGTFYSGGYPYCTCEKLINF